MEIAEVPSIFLSHSGKQKEFTWRLYQELMHAGHHPFFDQDVNALPKGHHFPARIVDACRRCKMGIVVLSHDYMESLWPMVELEQLAFHNPSIYIYPLFYRLQPADLSNDDNLRRWQSRWDSRASSWPSRILQASSSHHFPINIDMSSWPTAVRMLKFRNGEVLPSYMEDHAYIERIVSNICTTLPPPQRYLLGGQFKGMARMQEDMDLLFQLQDIQENGVIALGVYGMGGSGKSTLCKSMANLYNKDFPGRSCWMEFPFHQDNEDRLLEAIKKVLPILSGTNNEALSRIYNIAEAMSHLEESLKRHKVFLAIDNLWDRDLEIAKQILEMKYISGSRVMITSRSKQVLQYLLPMVVHVPSITDEEAVEVLLYYSHPSSFPHVSHEDLRSLAQSCFYEGQCHPLLLKAVGDKLKQVGGHINTGKDWEDFILHLQACRTYGDKLEESVLTVLETSFLAMPARLQNVFVDLVTCISRTLGTTFLEQCEWLSMLYHGYTPENMRYELIQLEYHGLLEIEKYEDTVHIHDLHKDVARKHLSKDAACNYFFEGDISGVEGGNWKYALGTESWTTRMGIFSRSIKAVSLFSGQLEILNLFKGSNVTGLSVQGMGSLRFLRLDNCYCLKRIEGWKGAHNLVSIVLRKCHSLQNVGDIGCLGKLEKLVITGAKEWFSYPQECQINLAGLPDLTGCHELKTLTFCGIESLECLASLGQPPKLQELDVSNNRNLVDVGALGTLTALWKLDLHDCWKLQEFPNVKLRSLCILNLNQCKSLERIKGNVCALTSLEELHLDNCRKLQKIPDLNNLARLRILNAHSCVSLGELKLGVSVLNSLQDLDLDWCCSLECCPGLSSTSVTVEDLLLGRRSRLQRRALQTTISADREPLSVFKNMRRLLLGYQSCAIVSLDVSGLVSLEELSLYAFTSLRSITGLGGLCNLHHLTLHKCAPMDEELGGLGDLTKLVELVISRGMDDGGPIMMASLPDMKQLTSLERLRLIGFSAMESLPDLKQLTSLQILSLIQFSSLTTLPPLPASLATIQLCDCTALTDVSTLTCLTSLRAIDLTGCCSLRKVPHLGVSVRIIRHNKSECSLDVPSLSLSTSVLSCAHNTPFSFPL